MAQPEHRAVYSMVEDEGKLYFIEKPTGRLGWVDLKTREFQAAYTAETPAAGGRGLVPIEDGDSRSGELVRMGGAIYILQNHKLYKFTPASP